MTEVSHPSERYTDDGMSKLPKPLPPRIAELPIRGITAMGLDIGPVQEGQEVELVREPDNPVDEKAVQVWLGGLLIGYLPRDIAARMENAQEWRARIKSVHEFEGRNAGVRLTMERVGISD